jgi:D-3-phosphoglycerate dehydrogenase / 2-oxoglutarate reductase
VSVVLVTPRSFRESDSAAVARLEEAVDEVRYNDLGRPLSAVELRDRLADVDGLLAGLDAVDGSALEAAPRLRVVARYGAGVDNVDLQAAARRGVAVTNTPGANAGAVAEWTLLLMLAMCRPLMAADRAVREGRWPVLRGRELSARTVGLLGLGRVGERVAAGVAGLGGHVLAHDPYLPAPPVGVELVELDELARRSEVLSLHAPLTCATRGVVGADLLSSLPPGAVLVNTARGELIDEAALLAALETGPLAAAALDVLAEEPPPADHPLLGRDDVLITPHAAPHTAEATEAMARAAVDDLLAVLEGREPRFAIGVEEEHAGGR